MSPKKPLRVVICTSGSRGEVQPYVAVAKGLQARGHNVSLATEMRMKGYVEGYGVDFLPIAGDPTSLLFEKDSQKLLQKGDILKVMKAAGKNEAPFFEQTLHDVATACEGADVVVSGQLVLTKTISAAEKERAGWIPVLLGPSMPTRQFPPFLLANNLGIFNRVSYDFIFWAIWKQEQGKVNPWRTNSLKLAPLDGLMAQIEKRKFKVALAIPECIIPGQKRPMDWSPESCICGPVFMPATPEDRIQARLREFISAGEPPVYLGFGSMPAPDPLALVQLAVEVTKSTNRRAVLVAGWSELSRYMQDGVAGENRDLDLPSELFITNEAPHDWLFPRCSALVIHCGLGTAYAALQSGVPVVCCPVMLDQPWVASRLHALGVAAAPVPFHQLTPAKLVAAISSATAPNVVQRAREMAQEISSYDGLTAVCTMVEEAAEYRPWPDLKCQHQQLRHECTVCNASSCAVQ